MKKSYRFQPVTSPQGTTLLEVLLATAILSMSLTAISQLATTGVNAGLRVQIESEAAQMCQTQLDLLLAGALPLRNVSQQPIQHARDWLFSISIVPVQHQMVQVVVEVNQESGNRFSHAEVVQLLHSDRFEEESQ